MGFKYLGLMITQTVLTTVAVMGLVLVLIGQLPDYATFEGETRIQQGDPQVSEKGLLFQSQWQFWKNCFFADGGFSRVHPEHSVGMIIRRDGMISLSLVGLAILTSVFLGGVLGILAAYHKWTWIHKLGLIFVSMPSFLLVPVLVYFFSWRWNLLPAALWEGPKSLILPVLTLSARPIFFLSRIFSEQLLEVSKADFVTTAKSKGLSKRHIWFYHILPNGFTAYIVGVGHLFGQFIAGSFLVETLFALPGLGLLFVKSLAERDYPIFLALVLLFTVVLQVGHRLSDVILKFFGETQFSHQQTLLE